MENQITIIEGPTPTFERISSNSRAYGGLAWMAASLESPYLFDVALTVLRTFNSELLLERCRNAWQEHQSMYLVFKDRVGLKKEAPILAARAADTPDGEVLMLWVRLNPNDTDLMQADDMDDDLDDGIDSED